MTAKHRTALVVSAHSAGFVWRAGGESAKLWRRPGMTLEQIKAAPRDEAKRNIGITASRNIEYAEGYMRLTPAVVEVL